MAGCHHLACFHWGQVGVAHFAPPNGIHHPVADGVLNPFVDSTHVFL